MWTPRKAPQLGNEANKIASKRAERWSVDGKTWCRGFSPPQPTARLACTLARSPIFCTVSILFFAIFSHSGAWSHASEPHK